MATQAQRTFATRIDIPEASREKLVELLNARLADAFDLYSQLKQAHWNVKGSDFIQLHELYDDVAESVLEQVDEIAERATALGGLALGTARMAASASTLDEYPFGAVAGMDTVEAIADRLSAYGASVRMAIEAAPRARGPGHSRSLHRGLARDRQAPLVRRGAPAGLERVLRRRTPRSPAARTR